MMSASLNSLLPFITCSPSSALEVTVLSCHSRCLRVCVCVCVCVFVCAFLFSPRAWCLWYIIECLRLLVGAWSSHWVCQPWNIVTLCLFVPQVRNILTSASERIFSRQNVQTLQGSVVNVWKLLCWCIRMSDEASVCRQCRLIGRRIEWVSFG